MASNSTGDLVARIYANFRGADFRGEEINITRSPDCLNVWKDYKETESIRTRPGMALHTEFTDAIYGIFFFLNQMLVHSGTKLYKVIAGVKTELYSNLNEIGSNAFVNYDEKTKKPIWYFKDGKHYLAYDGETIGDVVGYIPTTSIARKPNGGGTIYQGVNFLSDYRINTFLADGASNDFYLDTMSIDTDFVPEVTVDDERLTSGFTVDYAKGMVTITQAPDAPQTDGQDNVSIKFKKHIPNYKENILKSTLLQVFDNRVFFSGNADYPNYIWHSGLNDPTYCSDLYYYQEGMDAVAVTGLVAGNNALWVFREPSDANTNVFYHNPGNDAEYGKIYPSTHSSITTGCVGRAINFNDDIVFFSDRGMEGISGDITTEQMLGHRSTLIDRKLIAEHNYKDMLLDEWEGYLFVFIGNKAYLADSRAMFTNGNHVEYDWFYWEMEKPITSTRVHNGILYLGTADGIYTLTDTTKNLESYWVTPKDKIDSPQKQKTTNKRGCVVEATTGTKENNFVGEISLFVKLENTDFELVGTYENVTDYFVSRIKRKKWKDIQLKFHSNTRFSLETATLECFIGGYVKR